MREKALQAKVLEYLRSQPGVWVTKYHGGPYSEVGVPDLLACVWGRFLAIELKGKGGKMTAIQQVQLGRIIGAGGVAICAYSVADVEQAVKGILE